MSVLRKTQALIHLDHIEHNLRSFRASIDSKVKIAAVVKANAYGHDITAITALLLENGVDYIAVATLQEALHLRRRFARAPLFVMGFTPDDLLPLAVEQRITLTVFSLAQCQILSHHGRRLGIPARVHVKLDTGFNRLGYKDHQLAVAETEAASQLAGLEVEGIFSHLALTDVEADTSQYRQLLDVAGQLAARGVSIPLRHICDSIAAVAYPHFHLDMVRLGALLYGYCSRPTSFVLKPAMTLRTEVAMVKEIGPGEGVSYGYLYRTQGRRKIATLPVGYADGLPRNIWRQGHVLIKGQVARYAGLPCMDQCMVDTTGLDVAVGDEAVIFGPSPAGHLPLGQVASWCDTNRNELLTRISARVPRLLLRQGHPVATLDYSEGV